MKNITTFVTKTLKHTKMLSLGLGLVGAMALAVGFASPSFAHGGYSNDGWYSSSHYSYSSHHDYNAYHCYYGHDGWRYDWKGDCVYDPNCHDGRVTYHDGKYDQKYDHYYDNYRGDY